MIQPESDRPIGTDRRHTAPRTADQLDPDVRLDLAREAFLQAVITAHRPAEQALDEIAARRLRRLLEDPPAAEIDTDGPR